VEAFCNWASVTQVPDLWNLVPYVFNKVWSAVAAWVTPNDEAVSAIADITVNSLFVNISCILISTPFQPGSF